MEFARLLIPALRADQGGGFAGSASFIRNALDAGVGGFILFGGEAASVSLLVAQLRAGSRHPLLICSDLERGAGQQFSGATRLPPASAIAHLADLEVTRRAGKLTAREAEAIGVDCIFAPVADIDSEPLNPIVGTRAFGVTPEAVASQVVAWASGCRDGGCIACTKHFPGHGRTLHDSHLDLPIDDAELARIERDLEPFRALVADGIEAVMTAHVAYPALDPTGAPATLSHPVVGGLLRDSLGFDGLVITDGLGMAGVSAEISEGAAAVAALQAGCDLLLYPTAIEPVLEALAAALRNGRISEDVVARSIARLERVLASRRPGREGGWGQAEDRRWAAEIARRSLLPLRGDPQLTGLRVRLIEIDDDSTASIRPRKRALAEMLIEAGYELGASGQPLVAVYADVHAGKPGPGLSADARRQLDELLIASPDAVILLFAHPRFAASVPAARNLLCAWGGERPMQEAAVHWLRSTR